MSWKDGFNRSINVLALKVNTKSIKNIHKRLFKEKHLLDYQKCKSLVVNGDEATLFLSEKYKVDSDVPHSITELVLKETGLEKVDFHKEAVKLSFENFSKDEIFEQVIPAHLPKIKAFETVGHIAHMNLPIELDEYKSVIGEIILCKSSRTLRTVVNKLDGIHNVFRNFKMEVIAGEHDFIATVKECNCIFNLDFSKVYWKLQAEHARLVDLFKPNDVICDLFVAGVGPFAIPAAKKKCIVYANDLNPDSYLWLQKNMELNKIKSEYLKPFNLDARDFFRKAIAQVKLDGQAGFNHFIMNLPASSISFLDLFRNFGSPDATVHCYTFIKQSEVLQPSEIIFKLFEDHLGFSIEPNCNIHFVRNVAPYKDMYCVSFKLPSGSSKRCKLENDSTSNIR